MSVYIATDPAKRYGFVEFGDVGITLAIGALDNLQVDFGGGGNLRIRRPNDYKPDLAQRDGLVVDTSAWIGSVKGCRAGLPLRLWRPSKDTKRKRKERGNVGALGLLFLRGPS